MALATVAIVQAILYLLFVRAIDLYEREPLRYVISVFVWGFTVAAITALIFNSVLSATLAVVVQARLADLITAVLGAPVIEECAKGLALLVVFGIAYVTAHRRGVLEFSGVMDGIVYGSAVGFGFSLAEDLLYFAQYGSEVFLTRRIFGGFGHAAFASLTGIGIGLAPWVRSGLLKIALPVLGLLGAILLHALFNLAAVLFGPLAYVLLFVVIVLYVILIASWLAVERRTIRDELREEVDRGTISPDEYAILPTYFRRTFYYLRLIFAGRLGLCGWTLKVHRAAVDLALTKRLAHSSWALPGETSVWTARYRITRLRASREMHQIDRKVGGKS